MTKHAIAILCSDLHLSHAAPFMREQRTWYNTMTSYLEQLRRLTSVYDECPIVCAGDVFDHWKSCPELVNFALEHLPDMYAVPGQHDLAHHSYDDIERTAYWTLVKAGKIRNLKENEAVRVPGGWDLTLWGFPWGSEVSGVARTADETTIHLAVIHHYLWKDNQTSFKGAPSESKTSMWIRKLEGYDAAVFGDNHKGFSTKIGETNVINCGGFIRRKIDETDYDPRVGILWSNGVITKHFLDTSSDFFIGEPTRKNLEREHHFNANDFLRGLRSLGEHSLDFNEAINHYISKHNIKGELRRILIEATELFGG